MTNNLIDEKSPAPDAELAKLTVRLYANDLLVAQTDDEGAWCAVLNKIMQRGEFKP